MPLPGAGGGDLGLLGKGEADIYGISWCLIFFLMFNGVFNGVVMELNVDVMD